MAMESKLLAESISKAECKDILPLVQKLVEVVIKEVLEIDPEDVLDLDLDLEEYGVDRFTLVEIEAQMREVTGSSRIILKVDPAGTPLTLRSLAFQLSSILRPDVKPTLSTVQLIKADCQLPADIRRGSISEEKPARFKKILLTGSTGHMGSFFLSELAKTDVKIYCLIRASDMGAALKKLRKMLKKQQLSVDTDKIEIVLGNLSSENLGLEDYETLAHEIDAIAHFAGSVNHIADYASLRQTNVMGIVSLIRFASLYKVKPILHASSVSAAISEQIYNGADLEEESDILNANTYGYPVTKFVAEQLMDGAREIGIPTLILRFGIVLGDSVTGRFGIQQDHFWSAIISSIAVGMFPEIPDTSSSGTSIMAVDVAAKIACGLFLNDGTEYGLYEVLSEDDVQMEDILEIATELGFKAKMTSFEEWKDAVFNLANDKLLSPYKDLYDSVKVSVLAEHPMAQAIQSRSSDSHEKLMRNLPGAESIMVSGKDVLRRHLEYFYRS